MKTKRWLIVLLCVGLTISAIGCAVKPEPQIEYKTSESSESSVILSGMYERDYSTNGFFIKKVEYQECNEYIVCHRFYTGEVTEIVNIGIREQPLIIVNERIYYATGLSLVSVNLGGGDQKVLNPDNGDTFELMIDMVDEDGEWLYCSGRKMVEIYGDPVALDGVHFLPAHFRVKPDFSEYSEVAYE